MSKFTLTRAGLDVSHLLASVQAGGDVFKTEMYREKWPATADIDCPSVYLRMVPWPMPSAGFIYSSMLVVNWSAAQLAPNFMAALVDLDKLLDHRLARASLVQLTPTGNVLAHPSHGPYFNAVNRFYLCVSESPDAALVVADDGFAPQAGELWQVSENPQRSCVVESNLYLICDQWKTAAGNLQHSQTPKSHCVLEPEAHSTTTPAPQLTAVKPRGKVRKKPIV